MRGGLAQTWLMDLFCSIPLPHIALCYYDSKASECEIQITSSILSQLQVDKIQNRGIIHASTHTL